MHISPVLPRCRSLDLVSGNRFASRLNPGRHLAQQTLVIAGRGGYDTLVRPVVIDLMHRVIARLLPLVLAPVRRAVRAAVRICSPPHEVEQLRPAWYRIQGEHVARSALWSVICGNSDPAGFARTARESLLWQAAERCEREHMARLGDLQRAGLVPAPIPLHAGPLQEPAIVQPSRGGIAVEFDGSQYPWLVRAAQAALTAAQPTPWRPQSDARFWRFQEGQRWTVLDLDNPKSVRAAVGLAQQQPDRSLGLVGYFLGFRAEATLFLRGGVIGIAPQSGEERFCTPEAIEAAGYAELVRTARGVRRHLLAQHQPHQGWRFWRAADPGSDLDQLRRRFWLGFLEVDNPEDYWSLPAPGHPATDQGLRDFLYRAIIGGDPEGRTRDFTRGLAFSLITLPDGEGLSWGHVLTPIEGEPDREVPSLRIFSVRRVRRLAARRCSRCDHHVIGAVGGAACPRTGCGGTFAQEAIQVCAWCPEQSLGNGSITPAVFEE
jgi:hypothetical protein